jgi:hypothetical protein
MQSPSRSLTEPHFQVTTPPNRLAFSAGDPVRGARSVAAEVPAEAGHAGAAEVRKELLQKSGPLGA